MSRFNSPRNDLWSRSEHILAFDLYCRTPFGRMHHGNPDVIALAELIGRSSGSVARKLSNFARLDPTLKNRGIKGLTHGAKGEEDVWGEFSGDWEALANESAKLKNKLIAPQGKMPSKNLAAEYSWEARDQFKLTKIRVGQSFFRDSVLAAYNNKCCITGIGDGRLLTASHIVPWSIDKSNRVNPQNGLCLNALHDRAFDRGLITVTQQLRVKISRELVKQQKNNPALKFFTEYEGREITLPSHFVPNLEFLRYHNTIVFENFNV